MAGLKVNVNVGTEGFKKELEIIHKHIGDMLEELNNICPECGSRDIQTSTLKVDGDEIIKEYKDCHNCESRWFSSGENNS